MDNWVTFLLVNVVLVIILGVLTNLATPWVKATFEKSLFSSRKKRVQAMISRYRFIKSLRNDVPMVNFIILRYLSLAVAFLAVLVVSTGYLVLILTNREQINQDIFNITLTFLMILFGLLMVGYLVTQINNFARDITDFHTYKEKVISKAIKLGGNPEELDKLDREIEEEEQGG